MIMPNNLPDHCVAFGGSRPKDSVPICLLANLVLTHFSFGLPTIKLGHYSMPRWRRPLDLVGHSVKKYRPFPSFLPSFLSFPLVMFSTNKIQQISGIPNLQGPPCMRYIYIYIPQQHGSEVSVSCGCCWEHDLHAASCTRYLDTFLCPCGSH